MDKESANAQIKAVTEEYRLQATWLASLCNPEPRDNDCPQALTLAYMKLKRPLSQDNFLDSQPTLTIASDEPQIILQSKDKQQFTLPTCRHCGTPLQAGWQRTNMRKSAPAQRRLSKTQARKARRRRIEAKTKDTPRRQNCFVVQCGTCAGRNDLAGKIKATTKRKKNTAKQDKTKSLTSRKVTTVSSQPPGGRKRDATATTNLTFVPLPESSPPRAAAASKAPQTLAAAAGKKKKLKKTNLMNFLSSLND